eukprot:5073726-Pleurochrysis_carterae.AAC.1
MAPTRERRVAGRAGHGYAARRVREVPYSPARPRLQRPLAEHDRRYVLHLHLPPSRPRAQRRYSLVCARHP